MAVTVNSLLQRRGSPAAQIALLAAGIGLALVIGSFIQKLPSPTISEERSAWSNLVNNIPGAWHQRPNSAAQWIEQQTGLIENKTLNADARARARVERGFAYHAIGRDNLAAEDLDAAVAVKGLSRASLAANMGWRGEFFLILHEPARAVQELSTSLHIDPNGWSARYSRAWCYIRLDRSASALADFNVLIAGLPKLHADMTMSTASISLYLPFPERIRAFAAMEREFHRTEGLFYGGRAAAFRASGRYDNALADYRLAIADRPDDTGLYAGRARTYFAAGNWKAPWTDLWTAATLQFHAKP